MNFTFQHRDLLWKNRKAVLWGAFSLVAVDVVSAVFPLLVKSMIDLVKSETIVAPWAWLLAQFGLWAALPLWSRTLSGAVGLASLVVLYIGVQALVAYLRYWWRVFLIWSSFPLGHAMRIQIFDHLLSLHRDFFKQKRVGDLLSSLTTDTENLRNTVSVGSLMVIDAAINFLVFPCLMFYLDAPLTLIVVPSLVMATGAAFYLSGKVGPAYDAVQNLTGDLSAKTHELVGGIRVIKSFAAEDRFYMPYSKLNDDFKKASLQVERFEATYVPALEGIRSLALAFALIYGGLRVFDGQMELSSLVAFQIYLNYMGWPMMALGWSLQLFRQSRAASKRIQTLMRVENPLKAPSAATQPTVVETGVSREAENQVLLSCRDLEIEYRDGSAQTLGPFSFELHRGEWLGLTGPVGSGKSSLLEALSRQRDFSAGSLLFRGQNLHTWASEEIAGRILYVPQEAFLFSTSLRSNLLMGEKPHDDASLHDKELEDFLSSLQFEEDLLRGRGGLNARLGERGINFSGGQKQRISLGRALSRKRELYLFDDVFSHVDLKTEARLIHYLKKHLPREAGVILVSHRSSTLSYCSRVLDFGREATTNWVGHP